MPKINSNNRLVMLDLFCIFFLLFIIFFFPLLKPTPLKSHFNFFQLYGIRLFTQAEACDYHKKYNVIWLFSGFPVKLGMTKKDKRITIFTSIIKKRKEKRY